MRFSWIPSAKQYLAKKEELVSIVYVLRAVMSTFRVLSWLVDSEELGRPPTFPPRTSSPMIKHAAVCIVFVALTIAGAVIVDGVRRKGESEEDDKGLVAAGEKLSAGRDRWRVS